MKTYFIGIFLLFCCSLGSAAPVQLTAGLVSQDKNGFDLQLFLSGDTQMDHRFLPFDAKNQTTARFFIDIFPAKTSSGFSLPSLDGNQWIQNIRIGKNAPEKIRLVLDLTSLGEKQKFSVIKNKKGVLISARGNAVNSMELTVEKPKSTSPKTEVAKKSKPVLPAKKVSKKTYRVVIDPGHGGADPGARGLKGNKEKDVVLKISKKVRTLLGKDKTFVTLMTRETDKTLKLLERTRYANAKKGDLFVSIHANASPRRSAKGLSTYFLNNADDQESLRVAMRENGELDPSNLRVPSGSDDYYLEIMKASMIKNFHTTQSTDLAKLVQKNMMKRVSSSYKGVVDLGVRSARFYVLTGAKMPAILVETSFISNPTEEKRLASNSYQDRMAKAIVDGIKGYVKEEQSQHPVIP